MPDKTDDAAQVEDLNPNPQGDGRGLVLRDMVSHIINSIGDSVKRDGIVETPARVVKSWAEIYSGYHEDPAKHLSKRFPIDGTQMVTVNDVEFFAMCEQHMLPF